MNALYHAQSPPQIFFCLTQISATTADIEDDLADVIGYLSHFGALDYEEIAAGHWHISLTADIDPEVTKQKELMIDIINTLTQGRWKIQEGEPCQENT